MEIHSKNIDQVEDPHPFKPVNDVSHILDTLKSRLPISTNLYNIAILSNDSVAKDTLFYTLSSDDDANDVNSFWIVSVYHRLDMGKRYSISAPPNATITDNIKEAFLHSTVFKWDEPYTFVALERRITPLVIEVSVFRNDSNITVIPTYIYVSQPSEVQQDDDSICDETDKECTIKELKSDEGARFLSRNWKYAKPQTFDTIAKILKGRDSVGVYVKGELVSGLIMHESGLLGMLYTEKDHRGKGYARIAMRNLMKKVEMKGAFPCSAVEIKNFSSVAFHVKLGMKFSHLADYIQHVEQKY